MKIEVDVTVLLFPLQDRKSRSRDFCFSAGLSSLLKCFAAYGGDRIVVWEVPSADGRAGRGRAGVGMHGNIRFIKAGTSHFETCWDLSRGVHDLNIRFKEVNRSINGGKLGLCLLDVDMHLGHID
jgi:hypothetical protein